MKIFEQASDQELKDLRELKNSLGFRALNNIHKRLLAAMREASFLVVQANEEQRLAHARKLGHLDAWNLDMELINNVEKELRQREQKNV